MPELWPKKEGSQTKRKLFSTQEPYSSSSGLQGTQIDMFVPHPRGEEPCPLGSKN